MIKKILTLLLITFVGFVGFSSAEDFKVFDVGVSDTVPNYSSYTFTPTSSSAGVLDMGGVYKSLIFLNRGQNSSKSIYFWGLDNSLYYIPYTNGLYKVKNFCLYNSNNRTGFTFGGGCQNGGVLVSADDYYSNNSFKGAMTRIALAITSNYSDKIGFCFIYDGLDTALCSCSDNSSNHSINNMGNFIARSTDEGYGRLTSNPNDFDTSYIGTSPWVTGGGSSSTGGSITGSINNTITGDYVSATCTWNDIFIALESEGYNKNLCYGGLNNFDLYDSSLTYNPIPGQGLTLQQIWAWSGSRAWDNFGDWFRFWYGLYKDRSNNGYVAMWESYPAVYRTYFDLFNMYNGGIGDIDTLLEYCNVRLTFTGSTLNNPANGYFQPVCNTVIREKQTGFRQNRLDGTNNSGGVYTGDVPLSVNWNGVGNMSGMSEQQDGITFIQDYFNSLKSNFNTSSIVGNSVGILPSYIIVFLLAVILFKFLRK